MSILEGDLTLNINCMASESEDTMTQWGLTKDITDILRVVFRRLNHKVSVTITDGRTLAYSKNGDFREVRDIQHLVNWVFHGFFENDCSIWGAIIWLEEKGIIPRAYECE